MFFDLKIKKNKNERNEFLGIDIHQNMIFRKKNFYKLQMRCHFSKPSKKEFTTRLKKTGLRFLFYYKKKNF